MRRKLLGVGLLGCSALGVAAVVAGPPPWLIDVIANRYPGCLYRAATGVRAVALTIDDGPDPVTTPQILASLRRHGARATFFMISTHVAGLDSLVRKVTAEGHELANHFTRDRTSIRLSEGEFAQDLRQADSVLSRFASLRWARPGGGWYSRRMITAMADGGYRCVLGSVYPYDATLRSAAFSKWFILRNARPGAIIVLHDRADRGGRTARVLDDVLPELTRRGYRVGTVSELVNAVLEQ